MKRLKIPVTASTSNKNDAINVCVIGLGVVGYPTALHIAKHGFSVHGYDIDSEKVKRIHSFKAFNQWSKTPNSEIYVVCASTGWKDGKPDMSNLFDICKNIARRHEDPMVCIESTVSVGTCRKLAKLFNNVHLVYVPHRYWSGNPDKYGVKQPRVIGALDETSLVSAKEFYGSLKIPLFPVSSLEVAEMIKIAENAYRFVQIAFSEQLLLLCEKNNMPFKEVKAGANTKWNINLLEALNGINGHCLPKDIRYLTHLGRAPLLEGAIEADKQYINYLQRIKKTT